jgi:hypothetical protein
MASASNGGERQDAEWLKSCGPKKRLSRKEFLIREKSFKKSFVINGQGGGLSLLLFLSNRPLNRMAFSF